MKIREFRMEDCEAVVKLWNECGLVVSWNDPYKDIQRKLKVDPELFLIGEISSEIIATVMGGYEGHRGWINYLAVSPDHQRKGYGKMLMGAVELLLKHKGCPKINLQIRQSNTAVIDFYKAIGYIEDRVVSLGKRLERDSD